MYTFDSRIRYSETDETGALSLLGVINYLQDCSTFQSEDIGLGVEYLEEKKRAWLLSSWRIVIDRYPVLGERIKIGTWATSSKGIYGYRDFDHGPGWKLSGTGRIHMVFLRYRENGAGACDAGRRSCLWKRGGT